jgi:PKD repeat protein
MASGNQVSKSFLDAGDYVVKLVAISSSNCVDTATQTISIGQSRNGISASFLSDIPVQCLHGNTFNFSNTSNFKGNGWINRYRWTFGDGSTDTTNSFVYNKKYTNSGVYAVQLIAMGSNGCYDTAYQVIEIKESPTANFSTGSTCGTAIHFTNTSSNSIGNYWNMGDGGALFYDSIEFTYTYTAVNWYLVTMINVAENGCTDTLRR